MTDPPRASGNVNGRPVSVPDPIASPGPLWHGHLAYPEASADVLVTLPNERRMHIDAARAFLEMAYAAERDGMPLLPRIAFRSRDRQRRTFERVAERRGLDTEAALRRAAPPGYSEHHTGYAVDVCDPPAATTARRGNFARRPVFAWMCARAADFGFEMSFPRDNPFGIVFEPWHWRWVGDARAQRMFTTARELARLVERDDHLRASLPGSDRTTLLAAAPEALRNELAELLDGHDDRVTA